MSDESSINMKSDGIELKLADGRTVRPVLEDGASEQRLIANEVYIAPEFARYGKDADDGMVYVSFEEVSEDE